MREYKHKSRNTNLPVEIINQVGAEGFMCGFDASCEDKLHRHDCQPKKRQADREVQKRRAADEFRTGKKDY